MCSKHTYIYTHYDSFLSHCLLIIQWTQTNVYVLTKSNNEYNGRRWKCTPLSLILTVFPHCLRWNTYYILIYLMMMKKKTTTTTKPSDRNRELSRTTTMKKEERKKWEEKKCIQFSIVFDYIALVIPIFVLYSFISLIFFSFFQFCALIWFWLSGCCTDTCSTLNLVYMLSHAHNSKHFNWNKKRFDDFTKDTLSFMNISSNIFSFLLLIVINSWISHTFAKLMLRTKLFLYLLNWIEIEIYFCSTFVTIGFSLSDDRPDSHHSW